MGNCCACCAKKEELINSNIEEVRYVRPFTISRITSVKLSPDCQLFRDQTLTQTSGGLSINTEHIISSQLNMFIQNQLSTDTVIKSAINHCNLEINKVTQNFYITSFGSLKLKTIKVNKINLLMNATIDLPIVDFPNDLKVETIRVPITAKEPNTLQLYLNDVADKIHENYIKNGNTLIYCHDGSFNTVALALGYLIKYTDLRLSEALLHMQYTRKGFENAQCQLGSFKKYIVKFAIMHEKNDLSEISKSS